MAIVEKKALIEGDSASIGVDSASASLEYYVEFDDPKTSAMDAISSGGFFIGQAHPSFNTLSLDSIDATPHDAYRWNFSASYSLTVSNRNDEVKDKRDKVAWGSWSYQRVVAGLVNGAGVPFDPPPTREVFFPTIIITKHEQVPNTTNLSRQGHFNSSQVTILGETFPAYTLQFAQYSISEVVDTDDEGREWITYENQYTIKINLSKSDSGSGDTIGFQKEYLNSGTATRANPSAKLKPIIGDDKEPIDEPELLTADGTATTTTANYILYTPSETFDFGFLGLPTTYPRQK